VHNITLTLSGTLSGFWGEGVVCVGAAFAAGASAMRPLADALASDWVRACPEQFFTETFL